MHQIESLVDLLERHDVSNEVVDVDLLIHVPVDDLRHVPASARSAERSAFPHPTRHQLERPGLDLLPRTGNADDHRDAPAAVTALERLAHQLDVPYALEAVVRAAVGEGDQMRHDIAADLLRIHEVSHAELLGKRLAPRVDVHNDDLVVSAQ